MAAVDSLLRLMTVRSADTLIVAAGQVPSLRRAGQVSQLSMPALQAGLVSAFVEEIVAAAQDLDSLENLDDPASEQVETVYQSGDGDHFSVTIERRGGDLRLTFRPMQKSAGASPARAAVDRSEAPESAPSSASWQAPSAIAGSAAGVRSDAVAPEVGARAADASDAADGGLGDDGEWRAQPGDDELRGVLLALLERALYEGASDVVLSAGHKARIRVGGAFVELEEPLCTDRHIRAAIGPSLSATHLREWRRSGSVDVALEPRPGMRFRVNAFRQFAGLAAAFRPIRTDIPRLSQLALPEDLYRLVDYPHGLVLVCGPTGSGKSTTLAALLEYVNRNRAQHVITLEDPIEFRYASRRALIHQREVGVHIDSFSSGLRAALRESPDIIMVGEMRDQTTIAAALTAAETGHLVLSTIHSSGAAMAIDRIIDVFPEHQQRQVRVQVSGALRAVLTQLLLPGLSGHGRVPVYEKMIVTSAIAHQIRDNKAHQIASQILTGRAEGMVPLERMLAEAVVRRRISLDSARSVTTEHQTLNEMIVSVRMGR